MLQKSSGDVSINFPWGVKKIHVALLKKRHGIGQSWLHYLYLLSRI